MAGKLNPIPTVGVAAVDQQNGLSIWLREWCQAVYRLVDPGVTDPAGITVGTSPFVYQNVYIDERSADIIVQGGTVSKIEISKDNSTYFDTGVTAGVIGRPWQHYIRVTYTVAPTMTVVPR